jgi:hypothetical protein
MGLIYWLYLSFYTQSRLGEEAFGEFQTAYDKEFTHLSTIKMILMEQASSNLHVVLHDCAIHHGAQQTLIV